MNYCPYCNSHEVDELTTEHVIPQSIGGDSRTLIEVCRSCNNEVGTRIDSMLSGNEWLRLNALLLGKTPSRFDRLTSTVTLKDGRILHGSFSFSRTDAGAILEFHPDRDQPDGTAWLSENAVSDASAPPESINVFRRDMVESQSLDAPPSRLTGMETAFVKVLLGVVYMDQGIPVLSSAAFDRFRSSLYGNLSPDIEFDWLDHPMAWGDSTVGKNEHAVYFECVDTRHFRAGVSLFGIGATISVSHFDQFLPRRCVKWPGWEKRGSTDDC